MYSKQNVTAFCFVKSAKNVETKMYDVFVDNRHICMIYTITCIYGLHIRNKRYVCASFDGK